MFCDPVFVADIAYSIGGLDVEKLKPGSMSFLNIHGNISDTLRPYVPRFAQGVVSLR